MHMEWLILGIILIIFLVVSSASVFVLIGIIQSIEASAQICQNDTFCTTNEFCNLATKRCAPKTCQTNDDCNKSTGDYCSQNTKTCQRLLK